MEREDLNNTLIKLSNAINEDLDEKTLKYANQYLAFEEDDDILLIKITSLIKLEKYSQALQFQNASNIEETDSKHMFLKAYINYRLKKYPTALEILDKCNGSQVKVQILYSQIYTKLEDFSTACDILSSILLREAKEESEESEIDYIYEDLCANFFNSLTMLIFTNFNNKIPTQIAGERKQALDKAVDFCLNQSEKVTLREVFLNLCILIAVNTIAQIHLFGENEEKLSNKALELFYSRLEDNEDDEEGMQVEGEEQELDDRAKDKIIAYILETIFQHKKKKVMLNENRLHKAEYALENLEAGDAILKASILSYVLYMKVGSDRTNELFELGQKIGEILDDLKDQPIGKQLTDIVVKNLEFNKAVTLFMRGKHTQVKNFSLSNDKNENNLIKHFVLAKKKKYEDLEKIFNQLSGSLKDRVVGVLMQLSVHHQMKKQERFIEIFKHLMEVNFSFDFFHFQFF